MQTKTFLIFIPVVYLLFFSSSCTTVNQEYSYTKDNDRVIPNSNAPGDANTILTFVVPANGNCMLYAVASAYLLEERKDNGELERRFKALFGEDKNMSNYSDTIHDIRSSELLSELTTTISFSSTHWEELILGLRKRIIGFMKNERGLYENFFAPEEDSEGAKSFDEYLNNTEKNGTYLGELHLRALARLLNYPIRAYSLGGDVEAVLSNYRREYKGNEIDEIHYTDYASPNVSTPPIILFYNLAHYDFALRKNKCH